jgi:hypothetical protein
MFIISTGYHLIPVSSIASIQGDADEHDKTRIDLNNSDSITCDVEYSLVHNLVAGELRIASDRAIRFIDLTIASYP